MPLLGELESFILLAPSEKVAIVHSIIHILASLLNERERTRERMRKMGREKDWENNRAK